MAEDVTAISFPCSYALHCLKLRTETAKSASDVNTCESKGQFPVRKNSAKCEKVRAKYVTGMRSDSSQTVRAKNFSAKKVDYS